MKWSDLLPEAVPAGGEERRVASVTLDSRHAGPGALFFALQGEHQDGHDFIGEAVAAGAVGVVAERAVAVPPGTLLMVHPEARRLAGEAAARLAGRPSEDLPLVAVTGTNGKTTVAWLVSALFRNGGFQGTLGWGTATDWHPATETTPDAVTLHERLGHLRATGARGVAMEASSHGLVQERLAGARVRGAIWTNLSPEHLDYHGDMAAYRDAKARLLERPELDFAVLNADDPAVDELAARVSAPATVWRYGIAAGDVRARSLQCFPDSIELVADTPAGPIAVHSALTGRVNGLNLLAAVATGLALGMAPQEVGDRLAAAPPVPGRLESVGPTGRGARVWVDYAHTPAALAKSLAAARELVAGALWCVFGCGGERDRAKRPAMGAVAEAQADRVVLTSDNPRGESPEAIMDAIAADMRARPERFPDRDAAIAHALTAAGPEDGVIIAGKGHEATMEVGGQRIPFNDADVARQWLTSAGEAVAHDDAG